MSGRATMPGRAAIPAPASTAAVEGAARNSHYGASKGGVTSFCRALAVELARHQIRVNSILPGWIETEMTDRAFHNEKFAANVLQALSGTFNSVFLGQMLAAAMRVSGVAYVDASAQAPNRFRRDTAGARDEFASGYLFVSPLEVIRLSATSRVVFVPVRMS